MRGLAVLLFLTTMAIAQELRVVSFNVRYPASGDGEDLWDRRKEQLAATVRQMDPDVMGTQELFLSQGEFIVSALPEYAWFGLSRRGNHEDEHMGVFYRKDRLKVIDSGNFWLSETPDVPGSISWSMSLPRMATWALFETVKEKRRFYFLNTHFPHRREDEEARSECARVIDRFLAKWDSKIPVTVTGDFNTGLKSNAHAVLTMRLKDAWLDAPSKKGPEGTFHGFKGTPGQERIDWILYRGPWNVKTVETVTRNVNGRYPSDHFPILAVFEWKVQ